MASVNTAKVILPSWRQGRLLFFTGVMDSYTTRLDYRVAAATLPNDSKVVRTFKANISNEELALCQKTADNGAGLQQFFNVVSHGNLDELTEETSQNLPPCAAGSNALIYTCSYFDFLRKYSVDQTIVKHYEAQDPKARFSIETSLSIYKILSAHLQPERAVALIDADILDTKNIRGASHSSANLLREVAIIRYDAKHPEAAIKAMLHAVKLHNTEDKWRRLADFAMADNSPEQAIEYYFKAEDMAALAPPQALRMAGLLVNAGHVEKAAPFLERIESIFPKQVENLRAQSEKQATT
ncbi:MAG: hypothetical protein COB08_004660 [Rhodobacteraceae bacterium]|nr:hypothetical protein [Paracoccaceae bacterium]